MMKKLIALFLALCLLCSLAGCSKQSVRRRDEDDSSGSTARPGPPRATIVPEPEEDEPEEDEPGDTDDTDGANDAGQPVDFLGSWNGNVYSNEFLGLSYTMPESWVYASDEELLGMINVILGSDIVSDRGKMIAELMKSNIVFGMVARSLSGDIVQIMYQNLENQIGKDQITEERYVEGMAAQQDLLTEADGETKNFGETYWAQLGGEDYLVVPIDVMTNGIEYRQWMYIRRVDDWMAAIGFTTLSGEDVETMTGGASAFAPLDGSGPQSGSSGSTGTSGVLTATGDIGRTFDTMFFDYTVVSAESPSEYYGHTAQSGNKLLVLGVKVKNDFGSTLPMYDTDFQIQWGPGDQDYAWAVNAFNDRMMPLEWEIGDGDEITWDMLFEVPANQYDFSLVYLEEYTDRFGNDQTGDFYSANFTLPVSDAA